MAGNQARLSIQGATDEILRRQQAAFAKATGELDRQNAWMAIPASTPALAVLGAKAAAVLERTPLADEWGDQRHQAAEHANDVRSAYPGWVRTPANVDEAAKLVEIDWKLARDRRVWERANGRDWPRTVDGRRYHRHHYEPRADGGSEALDNYGPMDQTSTVSIIKKTATSKSGDHGRAANPRRSVDSAGWASFRTSPVCFPVGSAPTVSTTSRATSWGRLVKKIALKRSKHSSGGSTPSGSLGTRSYFDPQGAV